MTSMRVGKSWSEDPTQLTLRPYSGTDADREAITQIRNATLRHTTLPEDYHDLTPAEMEAYYNRGDYSLTGNAWLMFMGTTPVAAAIVYPSVLFHDRPPGNFHLYVVPEYGGHGLGSRLLAHLEQAASYRGYPVLETTVAAEDHQSTNFLISHGFKVFGHSLHLACRITSASAAPQAPEGYRVASLAELEADPDFFVETANRLGAYDPNYTLLSPEEIRGQIAAGTWEPQGVLFVLDDHGRPIGVIRATHVSPQTGHLNEVRLESASRGRGLGRLLVSSALAYLASSGATRVELDTPGENTAAYNLALRAGFRETRHWQHFMKKLAPTPDGGNQHQ